MAHIKYSAFSLIKRALLQARPFWLHLLGIFLLSLLATPLALLKPYALKILIDSGFGAQPLPGFINLFFSSGHPFTFASVILIAAVFAIVIALVENLVNAIEWILGTSTGEKLTLDFKTVLFDHIQRLSLAYHDKKGSSDSLYRIQWDTIAIRTLLISNLSPLLSSLMTLIAMIIVMFFINPIFALISVCIIPLLFILVRFSSSRLRKNWYAVKEDESNAISVIHEVLSSLRVVKAFGREGGEGERFVSRAGKAVKGQIRMAWMGAVYYFIVALIFAIGTALFIYLGATYVHEGKMTLGELTLVLAYLSQIFGPLQNISKQVNDIQSSISSLERTFSIIDTEKEIKDPADAVSLLRAWGAFEFNDLCFSYNEDKKVLNNISFLVNPGDRVGIIGSTGAGKSTLINLITRFYEIQNGTIFLDGIDIRQVKLADYRQQFAIVSQDPVLFSTTIAENIAYGLPGASEEEIIKAAKMANAHEFIINSKDGYETMVGERGIQLSGGERQRISLARAFIKNAPVLIMDEPTSSLDVKTEALVIDAMRRLMEGRTSFMITHRLDTLDFCNLIVHIEEGTLVEAVRDHEGGFLEKKKNTFMNQV